MGKELKAARNKTKITDDGKKGAGKKIERKKTIIKAKDKNERNEPPHRPTEYVGVSWDKTNKKWIAQIKIDGKTRKLGYYHDEKEAARMYDEQAALIGKPVNFPLHEGMEQAVKKRKNLSKVPNANRPSKYVGLTWEKKMKMWVAKITIHGKNKHLGYHHDEKEAARMYDEQAALLGRPVNFPLHEGMEQAMKKRKDLTKVPNVNRPSEYVGVCWSKGHKKWNAYIVIDGKTKSLGLFDDEKEAACTHDDMAAVLGKSMNFPLHEGQEQAVKLAPKRKDRPKLPDVHGPSKYVGVSWNKKRKKWMAKININGKHQKTLGYYHDEKEAARIFDEQAILHGKPVNFLLHEGMKQAVKVAPKRKDLSKVPDANRPSKYVGVTWNKREKKWKAQIRIDGKRTGLGCYHDEKEAARIYDEQAILLGKSVNFPLHEGMEQAVKPAPKGSGKRKQR